MPIKNWWDKKRNRQITFYIYLSIVFVFTLTPIDKLKPSLLDGFLFEGADKIVHFLIFVVLTFFLHQAYHIKIFKAFIILFAIGVVIELLQSYLNLGRSFEWLDIVADTAGILFFIILYASIQRLNFK